MRPCSSSNRFWLAAVKLGTDCGNSSIFTPSRARRCALSDHLIGVVQHPAQPKALAQIEDRALDGALEVERIIRSRAEKRGEKPNAQHWAFLSQVVATMALLSCLTDASTATQIGKSGSATTGVAVGMTHWSYQLMSMKVLSAVTNWFSIMRAHELLEELDAKDAARAERLAAEDAIEPAPWPRWESGPSRNDELYRYGIKLADPGALERYRAEAEEATRRRERAQAAEMKEQELRKRQAVQRNEIDDALAEYSRSLEKQLGMMISEEPQRERDERPGGDRRGAQIHARLRRRADWIAARRAQREGRRREGTCLQIWEILDLPRGWWKRDVA